jgi:endo-1,4-beta-xylanase
MKWDQSETARGKFTLTQADQTVAFAKANNIIVRGHTTVWHSQLASYVSSIKDKATLTAVIQEHIQGLIGREAWKPQIYAWDVVNEIFNEDGSFRSSVFYNVLGADFVKIAFAAAKKANPKAKLYINDYK